jgi:general secretion pathway protein E
MQAIQTGHKGFTTVHAGNVFDGIERLVDLGVKRTVMAADEFISGIIYQRLLPVVCPHCKRSLTEHADQIPHGMRDRLEKVTEGKLDNIFLRGVGCDACEQQGVSGRTVAAQILMMDRQLQDFILHEQLVMAKAYWRSGLCAIAPEVDPIMGYTALDQGIDKMLAGAVSPVDVEDELGFMDDQPDRHREREFYENKRHQRRSD